MPQLNPAPWLFIFLITWLIFMTFIPTKTMKFTFPNHPTPKPKQTLKTTPFNWPWH